MATAAPAQSAPGDVDVQLLTTNDFHGRIRANGAEAGAAAIATYVKNARTDNPDTVFAAAGDLIGASTFESFIAHDKPTLDALTSAGLEVSAVGNHEFDQGYDDLVNRVMQPYDADTNPFGADGGISWEYIGANIDEPGGADAIKASWTKTFNPGDSDEITVGFVGAVTEHLPELVSPDGIEGLTVTDIVDSVNAEAADLTSDGADAVVLLVHEGAPSTDCATMDDDPSSDFGSIVTGVGADVDAIVSGHTHLAYDCDLPKPGGGTRPVVSAGQYGYNLNKLDLSFDPTSHAVTGITHSLVPLTTENEDGDDVPIPETTPPDPDTQAIVDAAVADADEKGKVALGTIAGPFHRATRPVSGGEGTEENRGGESTLGNLVADAQRWATRSERTGGAQIAFMNPGGLRADMLGNDDDGYPATLTYKQAANVQPFANTLVNMRLTGAQIRSVLEQQWQPEGASRPFLRLGTSRGFRYTYDPTTETVDRMWLHRTPIEDDTTYSVTVNSFLASGGDNFTVLADGADKQDTGMTDLEGMVEYLDEFATDDVLPVRYDQHAVGAVAPASVPRRFGAGDRVVLKLSSLAFTGEGDLTDRRVRAQIGRHRLGSFAVDNTVDPGATDDEAGTAKVRVTVPGGLERGRAILRITGSRTGTMVRIPIRVAGDRMPSHVSAKLHPGRALVNRTRPLVTIKVRSHGDRAAGQVRVRAGGHTYRAKLKRGKAHVRLQRFHRVGQKRVRVVYLGNSSTRRSADTLRLRVVRHR